MDTTNSEVVDVRTRSGRSPALSFSAPEVITSPAIQEGPDRRSRHCRGVIAYQQARRPSGLVR